ncbi:MAG: flagellar biosynthetic protein FliR [bacterium]
MQEIVSLGQVFQQGMLVMLLVTARIAPVVQLVPYLGGKATPQSVKTAISLALAGLVFPVIWTGQMLPTGVHLALLVVKEVLVGLTIGFVAALVFEAVRTAGQIIDTVRGQNMATALVPQLPERASVSGDAMYLLFVALFLTSGAHHLMLSVLVRSYVAVPVVGFPDATQLSDAGLLVARLFGTSFELALIVALPVVVAMMLTDLVLALVNKAAPQIQVYFLGMPLKAALGIFVLLLCIEAIMQTLMIHGVDDLRALEHLIEGWSR